MTGQSVLKPFFLPDSIAVIGVSRDPKAVGSTVFKNIVEYGYPGSVFPVNPFISTFEGVPCYPSVLSITMSIDLAVVVVPAPVVPSVLEEIGKKGIPAAIIISSGFSEIGPTGIAKEKLLIGIAKKYRVTLLGPNSLGVIHPHEKLNASFALTRPIPGSIACISQSGAMGTALLDIITPKGIGLSHFISVGNKTDVTELDCLEYLENDDKTTVIGIYLEQLKNANSLITFGKKMIAKKIPKPIVVLKGGRTKEGTEAVHSHTGALAGLPAFYSALFLQAGMIETGSTQEFINTLVCFSENPLPRGNACGVLTNAGGPAILATDTLISTGVAVPLSTENPNPMDLHGDAKAKDYQNALGIIEKNKDIHSILGIVTPQSVTEIADTANAFLMHKKISSKPMAVCLMGDEVMKEGKKILDMGHMPVSKYPEQTATMLSNLHTYALIRSRIIEHQKDPYPTNQPGSPVESSLDPLSLVRSIGITVPSYTLVKNVESIHSSLTNVGDVLVVKLISRQIVHKTDVGAVWLNVPKDRVQSVAEEMIKKAQSFIPNLSIEGILLMDMVDISEGLECIIGIKKEEVLGTLIMLGVGGIFVEILNDVVFRFAPLTRFDAEEMIRCLKATRLFDGIRGKKPLDKRALADALLAVSSFSQSNPAIKELDINPLVVLPQGVIALDCRIL